MPGQARGGPGASPDGVSWCGPSKCPRMSGEAWAPGMLWDGWNTWQKGTVVLRVCSVSGKSAEHHIPSGVSLEWELICAMRDEQPDIWDHLTSVYPQRYEFTCCLCLQPQYTCRCNSTSTPFGCLLQDTSSENLAPAYWLVLNYMSPV